MAIDFPNSPTTGQIFTSGDKSWIWDGSVWKAYGASLSPTVLKVDSTNTRVGINNQSPAYTLDVTGDINASSALRIGNNTVGTSETFTPTIVGSTSGSVTLGNGTLVGYYYRVNKMVVVNYTLTWGSTTTTNCVGLWLFSVPLGNALRGNGFGRILDAGNTYYRVTGIAGSNKAVFQATDTGSEVQNTIPMTWANGDVLNATFVYETSA